MYRHLLESFQDRFWNLGHHVGLGIDNLGNVVHNRRTQNRGHFRRIQAVHLLEPSHQVRSRSAKSIVDAAGDPARIKYSVFSILGLSGAPPASTSTVNSMSIEVSSALPVSSPAPWAA